MCLVDCCPSCDHVSDAVLVDATLSADVFLDKYGDRMLIFPVGAKADPKVYWDFNIGTPLTNHQFPIMRLPLLRLCRMWVVSMADRVRVLQPASPRLCLAVHGSVRVGGGGPRDSAAAVQRHHTGLCQGTLPRARGPEHPTGAGTRRCPITDAPLIMVFKGGCWVDSMSFVLVRR